MCRWSARRGRRAISSPDSVTTPTHAFRCINDKIRNRLGADFEVRLLGQQRLHGLAIELAIGLRARAAHGRALAQVEHAELDAGAVDGAAHDAVERIDLAHQVALAQPADRRDCTTSRRSCRAGG